MPGFLIMNERFIKFFDTKHTDACEGNAMVNIILCGGAGERIWPISRTRYPKQYSRIIHGRSLLQHTALRNRTICDKTLVVTNDEQYFMARDQLEEAGCPATFVLETVGRNTAAAIALACLGLSEDELVLVTPADHLIQDSIAYEAAMSNGLHLAQDGGIVTFGIRPMWPETGYGYIQAVGNEVLAFHEKPDGDVAKKYVEQGDCFWNSGIFLFRVGTFLEELGKWRSDVLSACIAARSEMDIGSDFCRIRLPGMQSIPKVSVDYAVMEKSDRIRMVATEMNWSDLGSFESIYDALPEDDNGNVVIKGTDFADNLQNEHTGINTPASDVFIGIGAKNNLIYTESKKIAAIDVSDLMIVDTRDALLVGLRSSSQKVKEVVEILKAEGSKLKDFHVTEYRPWGHYTSLQSGYRFKMRTMFVKPGHRLGLHRHFHRNEHWVIVNGTAEIEVEGKVHVLGENQSTYIPSGLFHRIRNPGRIPLVMVEVQAGDYLEEDDIERVNEQEHR